MRKRKTAADQERLIPLPEIKVIPPIGNEREIDVKSTGLKILDKMKVDYVEEVKLDLQLPITSSKPIISLPSFSGLPPKEENGIIIDLPVTSSINSFSLPQFSTTNTEEKKPEKIEEIKNILSYDRPLGFGLGGALEFLRKNDLLYEHHGEDEQLFEYRDEFGNIVTGKDAYKAYSHKFSGKGYGAKNRMRAVERARAKQRQENKDVGDTPLHSGAALREALEMKGVPYLELTGEDRTIIPYKPDVPEKDKSIEKRKKRLRKVKSKKHIQKFKKGVESIDMNTE